MCQTEDMQLWMICLFERILAAAATKFTSIEPTDMLQCGSQRIQLSILSYKQTGTNSHGFLSLTLSGLHGSAKCHRALD